MYIAIKNGNYLISDIPRQLIKSEPETLVLLPRQDIDTLKKVVKLFVETGKLTQEKADQLIADFTKLS